MGHNPHTSRPRCNVCDEFHDVDELDSNYRGMLECPECGTELLKNQAHDGKVKRDQHTHKKW